ncbi:hypothetical protein KRP22_004584 [Phytophthora ramorum]|nr:hypothetical protein KRP22_14236 [Phytophthora ramorum]
MFLPFKSLSTRQSAGYAVLCVALGLGIKYMDDHMPERDVSKSSSDGLVWSELDEQADHRFRGTDDMVLLNDGDLFLITELAGPLSIRHVLGLRLLYKQPSAKHALNMSTSEQVHTSEQGDCARIKGLQGWNDVDKRAAPKNASC